MINDINEIEIFSKVVKADHSKIDALFTPRDYQQGDEVLQYGEPVDGLYLMAKGTVEVSIPGFEGILATLGEGKSFGEMSLLNANDVASATVKVESEKVELLFCRREELAALLEEDKSLSAGFYHGSALMVASRLRTTNQKISGEISDSIQMATDLIEDIASSRKLGTAQDDIHSAGTSIVTGMTGILKTLLAMKMKNEPVQPQEIAKLADSAKEIYYTEFPVFDRVHQQLQLLGEHLDNVKRVLGGQEVSDAEGDLTLSDFD